MSRLDRDIARQSAAVTEHRQRISQKGQALRNGALGLRNSALGWCKQPSTLVGALLTGAVLARAFPVAHIGKRQAPAAGDSPPAPGQFRKTLQVMFFSLAYDYLKQALKPTDRSMRHRATATP